jgi:hypothetical protein
LCPPGLELRPLGRPARSQSLCRLRYPDSPIYFGGLSKVRESWFSLVEGMVQAKGVYLLFVSAHQKKQKAKKSITFWDVTAI